MVSVPVLAHAESHKHRQEVRLAEHKKQLAAERAHEERLAAKELRHHPKYRDRAAEIESSNLSHPERVRLLLKELVRQLSRPNHSSRAYQQHLRRLAAIQEQERERHEERVAAYEARIERLAEIHRRHLEEIEAEATPRCIHTDEAYVLDVPIRTITVDLNDPTVKVTGLMAENGIGTAEPFFRMIRRSQPDVAVTGTFFGCDNLKPVGDIVIDGHLVYFGGMGTALCITRDNHADMITVPFGHHHDWSNYDFVMACGPRLLEDHEIVLDPESEKLNQAPMLAPHSRLGVGITDNNKLVFVMTRESIFLGRLAKIMHKLGCAQAMNLDGGESVGFYCEGDMIARPGRWLTNAIVVYTNQHPASSASSQPAQPTPQPSQPAHVSPAG